MPNTDKLMTTVITRISAAVLMSFLKLQDAALILEWRLFSRKGNKIIFNNTI